VFTKALERKKKAATKESLAKTNYPPLKHENPHFKALGRTSTEAARPCHMGRAGHAMAAQVARPCPPVVVARQPVPLFYPPGQFLCVALPAGLAFFKNRFWASFWAYLQIT